MTAYSTNTHLSWLKMIPLGRNEQFVLMSTATPLLGVDFAITHGTSWHS